jgi:protein-disulfide isomerase-like protein with CxxC motif
MKTKLVISVAALSMLGFVAAYATGRVVAQGPHNDTVAQRLAEKFGVSEDEVKNTFTEAREEHRQQLQTEREQRLQQAVDDGVITAEQKNMLIEKKQEWFQQRAKTKEEHQQWMEESGIDFAALREYGCMGGNRGRLGKKW